MKIRSTLLTVSLLAPVLLHAQKPEVQGTFLGDGKDGGIKHLVVQAREPFSDQAAIRLVFTEKDPSASKKPDFDAGFKKLGSALILSVHRDGGIFGCEVAHSAHDKSPFTSLGVIKTVDFAVTDTTVSGRITTGGELDTFGQKWSVDLTFSAPLPGGAFAGGEAKPMTQTTPAESPAPASPPAPGGPKPTIGQLPLPASATEVEYKAVVQQLSFRSEQGVRPIAGELAKELGNQGWKEVPGSLVGAANAVLKREKDGANLTIMVQPAGTGCHVKVFTEGLDWSDAPKAGGAAATPPSTPGAADIEAEAQRLLKEALKGLPGL